MPTVTEMASNVFVFDNGGFTAKVGYASDAVPRVISNCITKAKSERRRIFIGNQLENECKDFSAIYYTYPFERGYTVNWDVQKQLWDYIFNMYNVDHKESCLIMTEPYFNFVPCQECTTEIMFEEYKFHSLLMANPATLSAYKRQKEAPSELGCLVIDSGFSFTHFLPYIKGKCLPDSTRRMDMGGKHLTNNLKELISYRQLNVMDETFVINQVKEDTCFVSSDFERDMTISRSKGKENTIARDYVLPDYTVIRRGYVRPLEETTGKPKDNEQLLRLNNERFTIPELLFNPSDINFPSMGIPEAIFHCISTCPEELQPHLFKNILLTGGNACFPGFRDRVYNDVRTEAFHLYDVNVTKAENPVTHAWEGGSLMTTDPDFSKMIVSRKQYDENGLSYCLDKFIT